MLQHLTNGWQVDQAILSEEDRVVVIECLLFCFIVQLDVSKSIDIGKKTIH